MNPTDNLNSLWVERYRPATIDECILPDNLKKTFKDFIASGQLPNFLIHGTAGVGKCLGYDTQLELEVNDDFVERLKGMNINFSLLDPQD